jgi:hypothetical protein
VLDSVRVTGKYLVFHLHDEVCRLDYRLAGSHVEIGDGNILQYIPKRKQLKGYGTNPLLLIRLCAFI